MIPGTGFEQVVGGASVYFQLARFIVVFFVGILVTRTVFMPIARRLLRRRGDDKVTAYSVENLVAVVGIFASITVALQAARFGNLATIIGTVAAALTIAVGFGTREQVGNLVSGLFIQLDSPFVKDDYIATEKVEGTVQEVKLRETRIRTPTGEKAVVPNSYLSNNPVQNLTKGRTTTDTITVTVAADRAAAAEDAFLDIAAGTGEVLEKPEPCVFYDDIEAGNVRLQFRYAVRDSEDTKQIRDHIVRAFADAAVEDEFFPENSK